MIKTKTVSNNTRIHSIRSSIATSYRKRQNPLYIKYNCTFPQLLQLQTNL